VFSSLQVFGGEDLFLDPRPYGSKSVYFFISSGRKQAKGIQAMTHKQVCLFSSLQVFGGEDLFLDPRP